MKAAVGPAISRQPSSKAAPRTHYNLSDASQSCSSSYSTHAGERLQATRAEIASRADLPNANYERLTGKVYFAVDPKLKANQIITDIALAPRNDQGLVEFSADLEVWRPKAKGNGTALVEISNRGGKGMAHMFDLAGRGDSGDALLFSIRGSRWSGSAGSSIFRIAKGC